MNINAIIKFKIQVRIFPSKWNHIYSDVPNNETHFYCTLTQSLSHRKKMTTTFLSVSGAKAFGEGHSQYIGDPSGMIDVRSTTSAPKQNPWANSKNNRPVWAYTQALNYQHIVLRLLWKNTPSPFCFRTWVSVLVFMSRGFGSGRSVWVKCLFFLPKKPFPFLQWFQCLSTSSITHVAATEWGNRVSCCLRHWTQRRLADRKDAFSLFPTLTFMRHQTDWTHTKGMDTKCVHQLYCCKERWFGHTGGQTLDTWSGRMQIGWHNT